MSLVLTEEQELLKHTAAEFARQNLPVTHLRELRDTRDDDGFSRKLWKEMAALGWSGITLPEEYGGADLGYAELGIVLEECGRTLAPYPFLSTVVMGAEAIRRGAGDAMRGDLLTQICSGELITAFAHQETPRFAPYQITTRATRDGDDWQITGEKIFVLDGHVADRLIVVARTSGSVEARDGLTLFLLDSKDPDIEIERNNMIDSHNSARVRLDSVRASASQVLGEVDAGAEIVDPVIQRATAALSSELVGLISEVFDRTVAYLKTREQFGVLIGSFQALKHRAANLFCEVELSQAITLDALRAIDEERSDAARIVSAAKARTSDTANLATCEGLQMHGGIGMTDEEEIGLFLKRAKVGEICFGDAAYHRDCFARLTSF
jgi:alkylation response protein AidB-like acyl-CoA dehydrogenase